jgi:hypothetical protein
MQSPTKTNGIHHRSYKKTKKQNPKIPMEAQRTLNSKKKSILNKKTKDRSITVADFKTY